MKSMMTCSVWLVTELSKVIKREYCWANGVCLYPVDTMESLDFYIFVIIK